MGVCGELDQLNKVLERQTLAFGQCLALHSIRIPPLLDAIDTLAFELSGILEIQVSEQNRHARLSRDPFLSFDRRSLVLCLATIQPCGSALIFLHTINPVRMQWLQFSRHSSCQRQSVFRGLGRCPVEL
jgi:hypothetical protein